MIDTHAHLDALEDAGAALARAREAGVRRVVTVGTDVGSCRTALALAEREEGVFAALGIHPHEAGDATADDVSELRQLLRHEKAVAIGETGLDFFRDYAPRPAQLDLFQTLVEWGDRAGLPIVVHSRAADDETVSVLEQVADAAVILHCFSSLGLLAPALERGWYVSFAGNVTFPKARDLRWAAEQVPADRLLAETDAPYLAPQPVRGKRNEPAHVLHTLETLADVRGEAVDQLERTIEANAARAFGLG